MPIVIFKLKMFKHKDVKRSITGLEYKKILNIESNLLGFKRFIISPTFNYKLRIIKKKGHLTFFLISTNFKGLSLFSR